MDKAITVEIKGSTHVGKTMVALLIQRALAAEGFTDVTIENADGDLEHVKKAYLGGDKLGTKVTSIPVYIKDNNAR